MTLLEAAKNLYDQYHEHRITSLGGAMAWVGMSYHQKAIKFVASMSDKEARLFIESTLTYTAFLTVSDKAKSKEDQEEQYKLLLVKAKPLVRSYFEKVGAVLTDAKGKKVAEQTKLKAAAKKAEAEGKKAEAEAIQKTIDSYDFGLTNMHRVYLSFQLTKNSSAEFGSNIGFNVTRTLPAVLISLAALNEIIGQIMDADIEDNKVPKPSDGPGSGASASASSAHP